MSFKLFNKKFPNIYIDRRRLYTKSEDKTSYFDEKIERKGNYFFREWNAERSKLAAGLLKGISQIGFKEDDTVLYLGASHGYTPSFVSDMIGLKGRLFAVEFAPEVARDLVYLSEQRKNIAPIISDANHPELYEKTVEKVDVVFQDVAQKNQVEIFLKNCDECLKSGGFGVLALKSRSVDVTKKPKQIYQMVRAQLEQHITVVDYRVLDPFEKDHALFVVKKK